jgi:hypothetical protein
MYYKITEELPDGRVRGLGRTGDREEALRIYHADPRWARTLHQSSTPFPPAKAQRGELSKAYKKG